MRCQQPFNLNRSRKRNKSVNMSKESDRGPALEVIKPGRKVALSNTAVFDQCFAEQFDTNSQSVVNVTDGVYYIDNALSHEECHNITN